MDAAAKALFRAKAEERASIKPSVADLRAARRAAQAAEAKSAEKQASVSSMPPPPPRVAMMSPAAAPMPQPQPQRSLPEPQPKRQRVEELEQAPPPSSGVERKAEPPAPEPPAGVAASLPKNFFDSKSAEAKALGAEAPKKPDLKCAPSPLCFKQYIITIASKNNIRVVQGGMETVSAKHRGRHPHSRAARGGGAGAPTLHPLCAKSCYCCQQPPTRTHFCSSRRKKR